MATFFTSDQHYGHNNIISYCNRPFTDINHMTEILIQNHNSVVGPDDVVWHLGDFSLSKQAPKEILPRLNGKHYLVMGNHDFCHPVREKRPVQHEKLKQLYLEAGFLSLDLEKTITIGDREVLMCHLPYWDPNPEFDQRYPKYRPLDNGLVLLHGHVHNSFHMKKSSTGSLMINVGVDVNGYRPVSIEEIQKLIESNT